MVNEHPFGIWAVGRDVVYLMFVCGIGRVVIGCRCCSLPAPCSTALAIGRHKDNSKGASFREALSLVLGWREPARR